MGRRTGKGKRAGPPSLIWGSSKTSGDLEAGSSRPGQEEELVRLRASTGRAEARVVVADVTPPPPRHTGSFIQQQHTISAPNWPGRKLLTPRGLYNPRAEQDLGSGWQVPFGPACL